MAVHPEAVQDSHMADKPSDEVLGSQKRSESFDLYGASPPPGRHPGNQVDNELLNSFVRRSTRHRVHSIYSDMRVWDEIGEEEIGMLSDSDSQTESNDEFFADSD